MGNDESSDKPSSTTPLDASDSDRRLKILEARTERQVVLVDQLAENVERIWDRSAWRIKLEQSRADHVLGLAASVEKDASARDRNTEAILTLTRKISEQDDDIGHIKGAVDTLVSAANTKQVVQDAIAAAAAKETVAGAAKAVSAIVEGAEQAITASAERVAEETNSRIKLLTKQELEKDDDENKRVGIVARVYITFAKSDRLTKLLSFFMVLFGLAAFLGWIFYKLNANAEAPQGRSFDEWRQRHPPPAAPTPASPK